MSSPQSSSGRFADLLTQPGLRERVELRSRFGLMAFHGGALEKTTDVVGAEVAERTGSSYYEVWHPEVEPEVEKVPHLPSTEVDPAQSGALMTFMAHVETVVTLHGYGRDDRRWSILLGGRNRSLAGHVAARFREDLPGYDVVDDLEAIPRELRGQHPRNPVNLAAGGGLQIELPPTIRWNWEERGWSDWADVGRALDTEALIDSLVWAIHTWR